MHPGAMNRRSGLQRAIDALKTARMSWGSVLRFRRRNGVIGFVARLCRTNVIGGFVIAEIFVYVYRAEDIFNRYPVGVKRGYSCALQEACNWQRPDRMKRNSICSLGAGYASGFRQRSRPLETRSGARLLLQVDSPSRNVIQPDF